MLINALRLLHLLLTDLSFSKSQGVLDLGIRRAPIFI
jgi:hypothetical protein